MKGKNTKDKTNSRLLAQQVGPYSEKREGTREKTCQINKVPKNNQSQYKNATKTHTKHKTQY